MLHIFSPLPHTSGPKFLWNMVRANVHVNNPLSQGEENA